jgi:hypothetical protein
MHQRVLAFGLVVATLASGCATSPAMQAYQAPHRAHPEVEQRARRIRTIAVLPPDIRISSLSAGGVEEVREDWSATGRDNVIKALQAYFNGQPVALKVVAVDPEVRDTLTELRPLFRAVSLSVLQHTYSQHPFITKLDRFEYSVGSVQRIAQKVNADAVLLSYGFDEISTGGRKALQAVGTVLPFVPRVSSGATGLCAALVDPAGTILWYNIETRTGGYDLREVQGASSFVKVTLENFPRVEK